MSSGAGWWLRYARGLAPDCLDLPRKPRRCGPAPAPVQRVRVGPRGAPGVTAARHVGPRIGRRALLRQALRAAAGAGALFGPLPLAGCAVGRPPLAVGAQFARLSGLLERYNATHPPAKVKAVAVPAAVAAGQPPLPKKLPDIVDVTVENLWVGGLGVQAGNTRAGPFLRPLDGLIPDPVLSALVPQALGAFRLRGRLYALPYSYAHGLLAFNDTLAVPAGFRPPASALTLAQLGDVLRRAAPDLPPGSVGLELGQIAPPIWGTVVVGSGGRLTAAGRFAFAEGAGLTALQAFGDICRRYGGLGLFDSGRALFSFEYGSAGAESFAKQTGDQLGLLPFPRLPHPLSPVLSLGAGITTQCRDVEGAAAFLAWLAGRAAQRYLDARGAPAARSDLQGDASWVPPLPPGDTADVVAAAPGLLLPQVFWHPVVLAILAEAQVAAFSPGAGSTVAQVFAAAQTACNRALDALNLSAD